MHYTYSYKITPLQIKYSLLRASRGRRFSKRDRGFTKSAEILRKTTQMEDMPGSKSIKKNGT